MYRLFPSVKCWLKFLNKNMDGPLVMDFEQAYRNCGHRLVKCRIGNLISHDMYSIAPIPWKGITMHLRTEDPTEVKIKVDKFSRELRSFLRMK